MIDHVVHLSKVLSRQREHELFVKKEKYEFASAEIMFLGHMVGMDQVRMNPKKDTSHIGMGSPYNGV